MLLCWYCDQSSEFLWRAVGCETPAINMKYFTIQFYFIYQVGTTD